MATDRNNANSWTCVGPQAAPVTPVTVTVTVPVYPVNPVEPPTTVVPTTTAPGTTAPPATTPTTAPPSTDATPPTTVPAEAPPAETPAATEQVEPDPSSSSKGTAATTSAVSGTMIRVNAAPYGAYVRPCPVASAACAPIGSVASGTGVTMQCWRDGGWATGNYASNRWFWIVAGATRGFVHSSFVVNQVSTPLCPTDRGPTAPVAPAGAQRALDWAVAHNGTYAPTAAEKFGNNTDRWSGWCALFAYDAHKIGNSSGTVVTGNAIDMLNTYRTRGMLHPTGVAPAGALLFWGAIPGNAYGHVAIATTDGKAIGTRGFASQYLPIAVYEINSVTNYAGWVLP